MEQSSPSLRLTVLEGSAQGEVFVADVFPVIIGRSEAADVRLSDTTVSRHHLQLLLEDGLFLAEDLSTNGTWVEDHLLTPGKPTPLRPPEILRLGPTTTLLLEVVRVPQPGEATPSRPQPLIPVHLVTLGSWSLEVAGQDLPPEQWSHRKAFLLLVYLAGCSPQAVPVGRLQEVFWGHQPEAALRALQNVISRLREAFRRLLSEADPVLFENDAYRLNPLYDIRMDSLELERLGRLGRSALAENDPISARNHWAEATALYRGPFLESFTDDWASRRRRELQDTFLATIEALAQVTEAEQALDRSEEALAHFRECEQLFKQVLRKSLPGHLLRLYYTHFD